MTPHELAAGEHERRQAELRKANEKLVLAALSAQELRAAAQLVQRRQAEFLALAAREMDGPMSALSVAVSLLGRVPADEPGRVWNPSTVEREVENMTRLLDAARAVERARTAMRELDHGPVDMTGIIDAAVDGCRPAMNTRRQRFEALMPAGTINVRGDVAGLAQIVSNLLDNASRSTPEGGQVGLFVVVQDDTVVMTVSDSGGGIIPQGLPEIFEPLDPPALAGRDGIAPDTDPIGVGNAAPDIGLAVVRALVEILSHSSTVKSALVAMRLPSACVRGTTLERPARRRRH